MVMVRVADITHLRIKFTYHGCFARGILWKGDGKYGKKL